MHEQIKVVAADDYALAATVFSPTVSNGKVILMGSANAVPQTFYEKFARYFAEKGYTFYTFDYRGIGASAPESLRKINVQMNQWGKLDLDAMIRFIRQRHPTHEFIYIGHSAGGQMLALTPEVVHIDRIILVACSTAYWNLWPSPFKWGMFLAMHLFIPVLTPIFGFFPGKKLNIVGNLPKGIALEWAKWARKKDYLFHYHPDHHLGSIKAPLLGLSFSDDTYGPKTAVDTLLAKYQNAQITRIHLTPEEKGLKKIGHFGFFRSARKDDLWPEILEWVDKPMAQTNS